MAGAYVTGADDLIRLGERLKDAEPQIRKDMLRAFREAGKPIIRDIKAGIYPTIPDSGGLNARVSKSSIGVRTRMTGRQAGVRIQATGKKGASTTTIKGLDESGTWRHPVYGNRMAWVEQSYSPAEGWFTEPIEDNADTMRAKLSAAMEETAQALTRGI